MTENNDNPQKSRTSDVEILENVKFSEIGLSVELVNGLSKNGFISPSPIQLRAIPLACSGLDILVQAKSGTGKTLVFACVILDKFNSASKGAQSLVIAPTREIAVQIVSVLNAVGKDFKKFRADSFIGGLEIADDRKKMARTTCIVATPGRCRHLLENKVINTTAISLLVLDEADNLITNDSMKGDIVKIYEQLPAKKQVIAASATFDKACEKVLCGLMKNPVGVTPRREIPVLKGVKQFVLTIPDQADNIKEMFAKVEELKRIFGSVQFKQCLVFANSQMRADSYSVYLNKANHASEVICGNQDQKKRLQVLEKLRAFKCRILLATDLMARGIDVENVNLIVNLEIPYDSATYLHRIGRAGRYGSHGIAITILQEKEIDKFRKMLGEIGGEAMSVLKFPDSLTSIDDKSTLSFSEQLWTFDDPDNDKQDYGEIFGIIAGSEPAFKKDFQLADKQAEIVAENLELLEISAALVNSSDMNVEFDAATLFDDYASYKASQEAQKPEKTLVPIEFDGAALFDDYANFKANQGKEEPETLQIEATKEKSSAVEIDPTSLFDEYATFKVNQLKEQPDKPQIVNTKEKTNTHMSETFDPASLFEDYENFKANQKKDQPETPLIEATKVLKEVSVAVETDPASLFNDYASFKANQEKTGEPDNMQIEAINEVPAAVDYASFKANQKRKEKTATVQTNDSESTAVNPPAEVRVKSAEPMIKQVEMGSLLNVIRSFMLELEANNAFKKPANQSGDHIKATIEQPEIEVIPVAPIPEGTALYADYFKMKSDLKLVCADKGSLNGHYVDTPIREAEGKPNDTIPDDFSAADLFLDYSMYRAMKNEQRDASVSNESTTMDPENETAISEDLNNTETESNYDTVADFFDDYARLRRKLNAKAAIESETSSEPDIVTQISTVDGRNDQAFLQAVQAQSNASALLNGLFDSKSIDSDASTIGSDCDDRLDDINWGIRKGDLIAQDEDSDSDTDSDSTTDDESDDEEDEGNADNPDLNVAYQQSYSAWSNMFWNQTTQILDYVKYTKYVHESNAELTQ